LECLNPGMLLKSGMPGFYFVLAWGRGVIHSVPAGRAGAVRRRKRINRRMTGEMRRINPANRRTTRGNRRIKHENRRMPPLTQGRHPSCAHSKKAAGTQARQLGAAGGVADPP